MQKRRLGTILILLGALLLAGALVPALYLFFKEYIDLNFRSDTKPDRRVMRLLLAVMCAGIGIFFLATIWRQIASLV